MSNTKPVVACTCKVLVPGRHEMGCEALAHYLLAALRTAEAELVTLSPRLLPKFRENITACLGVIRDAMSKAMP